MNSTTNLTRRARLAIAALPLGGVALAALLTGCGRRPIVVNAPPATVIQNPAPTTVVQTPAPAPAPTGREVIIMREAPPPPRDEPPPSAPPSSAYTWVPGYWAAREGRQEWIAGHWETPPRSNANWVAPRWERRAEGWVFIEGYWR